MTDQRFSTAVVEIDLPDGTVTVGPFGVLSAREVDFPAGHSDVVHVLTAQNPGGNDQDLSANDRAQRDLIDEVSRRDVTVWSARGSDLARTHVEDSLAIAGLDDDEAIALGRRFGQLAVFAWRREEWILLDCQEGRVERFAVGAVASDLLALHDRDDRVDITRGSDRPRMPRVGWLEVRDHLVRRLLIDEEWLVDRDQELTWWPTPLPLRVFVSDGYELPDGDNCVVINAETVIAYTDDDATAVDLVSRYRHWYPTGTLVYEDGCIRAACRLSLNPLGRSMLTAFHDSVLVQAAICLELAMEWDGLEALRWDDPGTRAHPTSGPRTDHDELVSIYLGEFEMAEPGSVEQVNWIWQQSRGTFRANMTDRGWSPGFTNDEVDFFEPASDPGADIALGIDPDDWRAEQFGAGPVVWARLLPAGEVFSDVDTNAVNLVLLRDLSCTLLGHATGGEDERGRGSIIQGYLPFNVWREYVQAALDESAPLPAAVANVANALVHYGNAALSFRAWMREAASSE